jgi:hypothetical protein
MGACTLAAAAATSLPVRYERRALERVAEREDRDTGHKVQAMAVCGTGLPTKDIPDIAVACHVAHVHALHGGDYELAMRYARRGCEMQQNIGACRQVAQLPIALSEQGIAIPQSFRRDLRHIAEKVCLSRMRLKTPNGVDVTARECAYLARQFNWAKDPEYAIAFDMTQMRFHASIQDRHFAGRLHAAACERFGADDSCELARELGVAARRASADLAMLKMQRQQ